MQALKNLFVLNAICAVASQYLLHIHNRQSRSSVVEFEGTKLPGLTEASVIQYQSACINLLIELSTQEYVDGGTLLAVTLLRFHEQTDGEYELLSAFLPASKQLDQQGIIHDLTHVYLSSHDRI